MTCVCAVVCVYACILQSSSFPPYTHISRVQRTGITSEHTQTVPLVRSTEPIDMPFLYDNAKRQLNSPLKVFIRAHSCWILQHIILVFPWQDYTHAEVFKPFNVTCID